MSIYSNSTLGNELPPLIFNKSTRNSKKYKEAVLDAFERIGLHQVRYNIEEYDDFYRMYNDTLAYKELKMYMPQYEIMSDLLAQAEIPPNVVHYDLIGGAINTLVGMLIQMQDKFHATDSGEVAISEFLEQKDKEIQSILQRLIDNKVKLVFAEKGINPDTLQTIQDEQERQKFINLIEQERRNIVTESQERLAKTSKFKTAGVKWAEATLEKDKEDLELQSQYKELFKDFLLAGKYAKITKIVQDRYQSFLWNAKTIFHSKDIGKEFLNDFTYAGRVHFQTPQQVLEEWGEHIDYKTQKTLLEGDENWKQLSEIKNPIGSPREVLKSNFNKEYRVPYEGYHNMLYYKRIEELTGLPMGEQIFIDNNGEEHSRRNWIPRRDLNPIYNWFAKYTEDRFLLDTNICQVTEVYFRAMEPIGYLTYEDENGDIHYGEIVTEDILSDFIKENNIKQIRDLGFRDMVENFEVNTIVWQLRPIVGWGVKIVPSTSLKPIYLGVEPMEHQIKGRSDYDFKLPVTGFVGRSLAKKLAPWQEMFNYCWNSIKSLTEKELGMFFLMDIGNIPSDIKEMGDSQNAVMMLRNMAKRAGIMTITTNPDDFTSNSFNQFSVQNVSHASEIQTRYQIANIVKQELYNTIGIPIQEGLQKTQHATNEGIKVSQEAMQTQIAHLYEDFNRFIKVDLNQHLSIAQYIQANNMDKSLYYTKSDESIAFLKVNDPKLPLRQIGVIVTDDSRKKKELELIRQALLSRNTMDMDAKGLIELVTAPSWRELMDVADQERQLSNERAQLQHQRAMEQIEAQTQATQKLDEEKWKREEYSKELDRKNKIYVETIDATGRAADKQGNQEDFSRIESVAKNALMQTKLSQDYEVRMRDIDLKQEQLNIKKSEILSRDDFKKRELDLKEKAINVQREGNIINKN